MLARRLLCVAPHTRPVGLERHLRAEGWELFWVTDLSAVQRLRQRMGISCCLVLLDQVDMAITAA